jgi:hypothetical protein
MKYMSPLFLLIARSAGRGIQNSWPHLFEPEAFFISEAIIATVDSHKHRLKQIIRKQTRKGMHSITILLYLQLDL